MIFLLVQTKKIAHIFITNILIICLLFFCSFTVFSQKKTKKTHYDNITVVQKKFNAKKIKDYKTNDNFIYIIEKREATWLENLWNWIKNMFKKILSYIFSDIKPAVGFLKTVLKILPYIIAGLVLFFIIKFFLKINYTNIANNKTEKPKVKISEEELLIKDKNLPKLIKNAIEKGNYRLAIRYYYLLVLKKLADNEIINWQREKTNEDYIKELKNNNVNIDFENITRIYDYVWYGNFLIDHKDFLKSENHFKQFLNRI